MRKLRRDCQLPLLITSTFSKILNYEIYNAVRSFLIKLYMKEINTESFKLEDLYSYTKPGFFTFPIVAGFDIYNNIISGESSLLGVINFKGERYLISCYSVEERFNNNYFLSISGDITGDFKPQELSEILLKEAVKHSGYLGKILRMVYDNRSESVTFKTLPFPEITLDDIYLKDKSELYDFILSVKEAREGVRYLFVGDPGTGKTDTIKAIIAECKRVNKDLTVFVVDAGGRIPLEVLFEYAEIFRPVLVCIDDIDLIVGSREKSLRSTELSTALQALDGFISKEDTFLIATTNDRELVDFALRRPGRFDLILEFQHLEPEFYPSIVLRETGDEKLASVFKDERVSQRLERLKATGAFLVTLVKYLKRERFNESKYDPKTVLEAIEKLKISFHKEVKAREQLGF